MLVRTVAKIRCCYFSVHQVEWKARSIWSGGRRHGSCQFDG